MPIRWVAAFAFSAAIMPLAVAAHFVSEISALGHQNVGEILFAARHWYLVVLGVASIGALISLGMSLDARGIRVPELARHLPFGGRGVSFIALVFGSQLTFFAATQAIEGCPVLGGDIVASLVSAVLAAALGSLLLAVVEPCFAAVTRFIAWISAALATPAEPRIVHAPVVRFEGRRGRYLFSIANRPPPATAVL